MKKKHATRLICTDPQWIGRADCKHCGIRHMMLFSDLEDNDFDHILNPIDNLFYKETSQVYGQGEQGNKIYSIRDGLVKLVQTQTDGSRRIVRLIGPGALIGLEALLGKPYRHTVIALKELDVCRFYTKTLQQLEEQHPSLNEKVMAHWEQHLSCADRWISELSSGNIRSRVLNLFSFLLELNNSETNIIRFFGYEDMALTIGTSRETFSRIVAELKLEGILVKTDDDSQAYHFSIPEK